VTYDDIQQSRDMPMRQRLEDLYLALQVIEELGAKACPTDGLDR